MLPVIPIILLGELTTGELHDTRIEVEDIFNIIFILSVMARHLVEGIGIANRHVMKKVLVGWTHEEAIIELVKVDLRDAIIS